MIQKVDDYRRRTGERVQIRIGIGTGPVVAGVIGKRKFIYDMWGDTVNVSFRLAADAPAETIMVDLMTHRRLYNRFRFEPGLELEIKGKGRMQVFQLTGATSAHVPAAANRTPRPRSLHRRALRPLLPGATFTRSRIQPARGGRRSRDTPRRDRYVFLDKARRAALRTCDCFVLAQRACCGVCEPAPQRDSSRCAALDVLEVRAFVPVLHAHILGMATRSRGACALARLRKVSSRRPERSPAAVAAAKRAP